jgi:drug/metabolite transporter (DMT)-like permease
MGLASAAQARATKEVETSKPLDPRLFRRLAGQRLWLVGIGATILGLVLQLIALAFAPLLLVQPLLITSLIFAGVLSARLDRRRVDGVMVAGVLTCVVGLSAFLVLARPSGNADVLASGAKLLPLAGGLAAVTLLGLGLSTFVNAGRVRVLGLAVATGVLYGLTAGLMKVVAGEARSGIFEPFRHWSLYVVCVIGPLGFLLSQNTFQYGRFLTPALAVITALDPLVGVAIGLSWMGETVNDSPLALAEEVIAGIAAIIGIVLLSHRASHLASSRAPEQPGHGPPHGPDDGLGLAESMPG